MRRACLHNVLAKASLPVPRALVELGAVLLRLLEDTRLLVRRGVGIAGSTGGIGEVDWLAIHHATGQVRRGLRRHVQIAVAGVHIAPFLLAPACWLITGTIRVPLGIPRFAGGSGICRILELLLINGDVDGTGGAIVANAATALLAPLLLIHFLRANTSGLLLLLLRLSIHPVVLAPASNVGIPQAFSLVAGIGQVAVCQRGRHVQVAVALVPFRKDRKTRSRFRLLS